MRTTAQLLRRFVLSASALLLLCCLRLAPSALAQSTQAPPLAGVQGKCQVLPGIDLGIPTAAHSRKASPDDTYAAVAAALKAGADGLILSRKYSEMQLANLAAAGRAVRDLAKG